MDEQKAALRRVIRAQMKALAPEERRRSDEALFTRFLSLPAVERSDTLLLYCGMGAEPDTLRLLPRLAAGASASSSPLCRRPRHYGRTGLRPIPPSGAPPLRHAGARTGTARWYPPGGST